MDHLFTRPISLLGGGGMLRMALVAVLGLALGACGGRTDAPLAAETPPIVVTPPANQGVVVGTAATFSVEATGAAPLAYQWSSSTDGATFAAIAGAGGASYSTGPVTFGQNGTVYRVAVSNALGSVTSGNAVLTVTAAATAPSVSLQPLDTAVVAPATATFTAAAAGTPSPTVQWQQSVDAGATWTGIPGATGAGFTTPATVLADSGKRFRAVFTNGSGSVNSNAAVLTVTAVPPAASLASPQAVAFDAAGNAYVADTFNHTVRKITPGGVVSTVAGLAGTAGSADGPGADARFDTPRGIAVDAAGTVYVADTFNGAIRKITPAGVVSTLTASLSSPHGIALDAAGNVYTADLSVSAIRKVSPGGAVSTLAGLAGSVGSADGIGSAARFRSPSGVAVDPAGNVYVIDTINYTVRKITPAGDVTTFAGLAGSFGSADGIGNAARFRSPKGIGIDAAGNLWVGDTDNHTIRRITPAGEVSTVAGLAGSAGIADGTGSVARFNEPIGLAFDSLGNVYVADSKNNALRKVTPAGVVTTVVH